MPRVPTQIKTVCEHTKAQDNENVEGGSGKHKDEVGILDQPSLGSHLPPHAYEAALWMLDDFHHVPIGTRLMHIPVDYPDQI